MGRIILLLLFLPSTAIAQLKIATFNAALYRDEPGQLLADLTQATDSQIRSIAEIIQRTNPDVLLINEFDYYPNNAAVDLLQSILSTPQNKLNLATSGQPVLYPYRRAFESNTGIASGFDLNNNGRAVTTLGASGYADDAFGFGAFPGQHAIALFSKYPILDSQIRSFQLFKWKNMPGNLLSGDAALLSYHSPEEQAALRLSSKNHLDIPIDVNGRIIHFLASHPTPPVFDSAEDRNGKRNHDEIRFWRDYITNNAGNYIYDDAGHTGGLAAGASFVILGDMNADPVDGDSFDHPIDQLLLSPLINTAQTPTSPGGPQQALLQGRNNNGQLGNPAFDTGDFNDFGPGNLRSDYIFPSIDLPISDSAVFWPLSSDPLYSLVLASDHRLVSITIPEPSMSSSLMLLLLVLDGVRHFQRRHARSVRFGCRCAAAGVVGRGHQR
ncbi:MAG TPA: endonuclease/exonuclease/phosphatase family protein [Tepidisphaeraceae bacterium]|nr:endonuclease/exonuclease/phosphatase family protein [Tepidisphaeraceae bacterium]